MKKNQISKLNKFLITSFLFLSFSTVTVAEEVEEEKTMQITPLHNFDCQINYMADGNEGGGKFDKIYSFDLCYNKFLRTGKDESICGQFSKDEQNWIVPSALENKTNDCYYGFAIAKNDYRICDSISAKLQNTCYIDVAIISKDIKPCTFLIGDSKNSCFTLIGPILNSTWISWFLSQVVFYPLIALIIFIIISLFVKVQYKNNLIIFSLILAFLEFLTILIFNKEVSTPIMHLLILVPSASLFLSAFIIKVFAILLEKINNKIIIFIATLLTGFLHGFLIPVQPFYKVCGNDIFMFGFIFYISIVNAILFLVFYTLFYFYIIKKIRK